MAHGLGLKVVAEGVESESQYRYLAGIHCDYIQGYFVSRPLPAREAGALLASTALLWPWPGTGDAP
jgi:EAL domain-containing protein (putative c-di-GMP-specific phosphodiesterase class I)